MDIKGSNICGYRIRLGPGDEQSGSICDVVVVGFVVRLYCIILEHSSL